MTRSRFFLACIVLLTVLAVSPTPVARADASPDAKICRMAPINSMPAHASITFKINHLGFSHYTGRFDKMEATLKLQQRCTGTKRVECHRLSNSINTKTRSWKKSYAAINFRRD